MTEDHRIDAAQLILTDLESQQQNRRRHFMPALLIVVLSLGGALMMMGLRPDLLEQPWWQLLPQCLLWVLCLILFPAIGLGLLFPSRLVRVALATGAVGLTMLATIGLPSAELFSPDQHFHFGGGCGMMIMIYAGVVLLMGLLSGAFIQRRKSSGVYWITAGISLTALTAITWQCPMSGAAHVVPSHLAVVVAVMVGTSLIGVMRHRRHRRPDQLPS